MRTLIGLCLGVICTSAFALTVTDHVKINEVYFAGVSGNPAPDGFIELYNAGSQTAFLDGALLLQGTESFAQLAFQFPGTPGGTNYPLASETFAVIAADAFDFSQNDPPGLDLSRARFETYSPNTAGRRDNPSAVNLVDVMGVPSDWFLAPDHGQVLLATGRTWNTFPCNPGEACSRIALAAPVDEVVDGIEYSVNVQSSPPILRDDIDAGAVTGVPAGSGRSIERLMPGRDSDNSTFDFAIRDIPSPGYQNALAADGLPPVIAQSLQFDAIYPNPFNSETRISFKLPQSGSVQLVVYDILGNPVKTLVTGRMEAGDHEVQWDGTGRHGALPTGVYIARLVAVGEEAVSKVILSR